MDRKRAGGGLTQGEGEARLRPMKWLDLPPIWLLFFVCLAALSRSLWTASLWPLDLLGLPLLLAGLAITLWSAAHMVRRKTTVIPHMEPERLVTDGPFNWSRNPIYLSDLMMLAGLSLILDAPLGLLLVPVFYVILTRRFIEPEEARLSAAFGASFDAYKMSTGRWL